VDEIQAALRGLGLSLGMLESTPTLDEQAMASESATNISFKNLSEKTNELKISDLLPEKILKKLGDLGVPINDETSVLDFLGNENVIGENSSFLKETAGQLKQKVKELLWDCKKNAYREHDSFGALILPYYEKLKNTMMDDVPFSVRERNCFITMGILRAAQLLRLKKTEAMKCKNFGKASC